MGRELVEVAGPEITREREEEKVERAPDYQEDS